MFHFLRKPARTPQVNIPAAKPKQQNQYGYYKMTCPFCLKEFDVWEMPFRANTVQQSTANPGSNTATPYVSQVKQDVRSGSMDRNTLSQVTSAPPVLQPLKQNIHTDVHHFPPEVDALHEEFLRRMRIQESHTLYKGKVLTVFQPGEDGTFDCEGIEAVKLFGSDAWIPATGANAQAIRHRAVAKIRDQYGNTSEERLCPHCHNPMPDKAGQLPSYVIMILGDTNSGKTVYKIRMLHELNARGLLEKRVGVTSFFCRSATDGKAAPSITRLWADTFRQAYKGTRKRIADTTNVMYIDPYTLTLRRNGKEVALLTLYDFPGEAIRFDKDNLQHKEYVAGIRERMEVVDGIMFLLDLTSVEYMADNLAKEYMAPPPDHPEFEVWPPADVLDNFMSNYLPLNMDGIVKVPICYIFSKADLLEMAIKQCRDKKSPWYEVGQIKNSLRYLNDPPVCVTNRRDLFLENIAKTTKDPREMELQLEQFDQQHDRVDIENILQSDAELRHLLVDEFGMALELSPKSLCFAASAVGAPIRSDDKQVEECEPVRVMEPLEYLLWQMGLLEHRLPGADADKERLAKLRQ